MYIRTSDNQLVNMSDKDVSIRPSMYDLDRFNYRVIAEGPMVYGWNEDYMGGKLITLHSGTQEECKHYFDWLSTILSAEREVTISQTPRPKEEKTEVQRYNEELPF